MRTERTFCHALKEWPDNKKAREGRNEAIEHMAKLEIHSGNAAAAKRLLLEHNNAPPELLSKLNVLIQKIEERERIIQDNDPTVGSKERGWILLLIGVYVTGVSIFIWSLEGSGIYFTHETLLKISAVTIVILLIVGFVGRKTIMRNAHNRRWAALVFIILLLLTVSRILGTISNAPVVPMIIKDQLLTGAILLVAAVLMEKNLYWLALLFFVSVFVCTIDPSLAPHLVPIAFCVGSLGMAYIAWTKEEKKKNTNDEKSVGESE